MSLITNPLLKNLWGQSTQIKKEKLYLSVLSTDTTQIYKNNMKKR